MADYDVIVIGAGPGGIFSAYELVKANRGLKVAVFELGRPLDKRRCPIDGKDQVLRQVQYLQYNERLRRRGRFLRR